MKKALICSALCTALISPLTQAEDAGFYAGASIGRMAIDFDETSLNDATTNVAKLFVGYDFNRYLALEGTYYDASTYKTNTAVKGDVSGYAVSIVGNLPVAENTKLFAKIGHFDGRDKWHDDTVNGTIDKDGAIFGLGASYSLGDWAIRAEYERAKDKDLIEMYSVGVQYKF
ncbi:MAG: porin family protein [Pseudomonadales bacterium]